jgi:hypothetical protein
MVRVWSYLSLEPRPDEKEALLTAIEEDEDFRYDANHGGEIVSSAARDGWYAEEFVESNGDYLERAMVLWETDEGPHVTGQYYDRDTGRLVEKTVTGGTSKAAVSDFIAREHDMHGPF